MEIQNKIIRNPDDLELQNVEDTISTTGNYFQKDIYFAKRRTGISPTPNPLKHFKKWTSS